MKNFHPEVPQKLRFKIKILKALKLFILHIRRIELLLQKCDNRTKLVKIHGNPFNAKIH